jgi:hypothetical protein
VRRGAFEDELARRLRGAPVPVDAAAEERLLALALAQHAGRRTRHRSPLPRLAVALAVALALGALLLTPAWGAVRDWVGETFGATPTPAPQTGLGPIPGGGRLLVQTTAGPWVVEPDGTRHLLRGYREASWSPHGLFLVTVRDRRLSAVEPDGKSHWTVQGAATIRDPRWAPSGERIAFREGAGLRVVAGDGSEDRELDESVAPLAPSWDPDGRPDLVYVDARGALRLLDVATGRSPARAGALPRIDRLEWGGRGAGELLEASGRRLRTRRVHLSTPGRSHFDRPHDLRVPSGEAVVAAALSPDGHTVAALLAHRGAAPRPAHLTDLVLYSTRTGAARRLGSVPGRLTELAWSPHGDRLLLAWPSFDQWLFVPRSFAEGKAMSGIATAFREPAGAHFPAVAGWCCRARSAAAP